MSARSRRLVAAVLAMVGAAWLGVLGACGSDTRSNPADGKAGEGTQPRIVALSPAIAIILQDVGAEEMIVGRHAWDMTLDPAVPVCGDQTGIDFERLIEVRPTHVLTQWGERALPARLTELAEARGWNVADHRLLTLADVIETCNALDRAFGAPEPRADGAGAPDSENPDAVPRELLGDRLVRTIREHRSDRSALGAVLLLHGTEPPTALGPGSFHHEILIELGATPAIETGAAYMTLDLEDVAEAVPGVIVLIQPRDTGPLPGASASRRGEAPARIPETDWGALEAKLGGIPRLSVRAVRERRVVLIDEPLALIPSSSLIGFAEALAAGLDRVGE